MFEVIYEIDIVNAGGGDGYATGGSVTASITPITRCYSEKASI